jgi:hypothetical protein
MDGFMPCPGRRLLASNGRASNLHPNPYPKLFNYRSLARILRQYPGHVFENTIA